MAIFPIKQNKLGFRVMFVSKMAKLVSRSFEKNNEKLCEEELDVLFFYI